MRDDLRAVQTSNDSPANQSTDRGCIVADQANNSSHEKKNTKMLNYRPLAFTPLLQTQTLSLRLEVDIEGWN